jgi:hexosaminidase
MIPAPKKARIYKKSFWLTSQLGYVSLTPLPDGLYRYLVSSLDDCFHKVFDPGELDDDEVTYVSFILDPFEKKVPEDYYQIKIIPHHIQLRAETPNGLRYAVQTLIQHYLKTSQKIFDDPTAGHEMNCLDIEDWPSFPWRGLHLDVSRHFFDYKFVYRYLNWMAYLKLNKFHWHLSDDQGWRIESKRFPRLHEVGGWRREEDGSRYGGYYTQKQVRLVVDYAAQRGIEVIPEIDIPGHSTAILTAHPELACFPRQFETLSMWGVSDDILCAGKDDAVAFMKELFTEVAELFPGQYIHLGGDEAPKQRWRECPHCQARIRKHKLENEEELQSWLVKALAQHLKGLGKTVVGWDEILDGKLGRDPVVMAWRGDGVDAARKAHDNGNRYVICPNNKLYFDWHPHDFPDAPGGFGITTIQDVYELDLDRFRFGSKKLFLGGQGNLWTERVPNSRIAKELVFWRMYPLAELFWSDPKEKDFHKFFDRMNEVEWWL